MTARTLQPFDPEIVKPWKTGSGRRGALLLHGFAGTPPELRGLGEVLAARGWRCYGPALAGHALTPEAMRKTDWRDWISSADQALRELKEECDQVVVAGQSTGGAIALHLAANDLSIAAVATLAAPVWLSGVLIRFLGAVKLFVRWQYPGKEVDLYRQEGIEELWSYGRRPVKSIHDLKLLLDHVANELPQVRAPVAIFHGERDTVIDPRNAADLERRLISSAKVTRTMSPRSGHGMSVDIDREEIFAAIADWFETYVPGDSSGSSKRPRSKAAV